MSEDTDIACKEKLGCQDSLQKGETCEAEEKLLSSTSRNYKTGKEFLK
jgi:hypothetical protein